MPLQLEALQANDGDCLLLHYGTGLILIDGGSAGVYTSVLKKRLEQLRGTSAALDLRMVVVSHIDADHITGIIDMFKDLAEKKADGQSPRYKIKELWHNSFEKLVKGRSPGAAKSSVVSAALDGTTVPEGLTREVAAVVASVKQGNDARNLAKTLGVTVNPEYAGEPVSAPEKGKKVIQVDPQLTLTVLGPHETELQALEDSWKDSKSKSGADEASVAADYLNRTVPNLSSIVVLAETGGKRLLLTGDAGGDMILKGLKTAGLLDAKGGIHVDLLKVQHHGSNHSVDIDFFRKVTADRYVISGNGKHGIPHGDTMKWLSAARAGEACDIFMTNRTGEEGLTAMLKTFLADEAKKQPKHKYHFREDPALSIPVDL